MELEAESMKLCSFTNPFSSGGRVPAKRKHRMGLNSHLDFKSSLRVMHLAHAFYLTWLLISMRVVVISVCVPSDGCVSVCRSFGDRGAQYGGESLEMRLTPLFRDAASDSSSSLTSNKQTNTLNECPVSDASVYQSLVTIPECTAGRSNNNRCNAFKKVRRTRLRWKYIQDYTLLI